MDRENRDLSLGDGRPTEATPCEQDRRAKPIPVPLPAVRKRQNLQQHPEEQSPVLHKLTPISPELSSWIKHCGTELKICKADCSWAACVVNDFRENLQKFLKSNSIQPFFHCAEIMTTGSYFERVKVHSPDEFDMMLKLQAPTPLIMTPLDGGLFYRLDLKRPTRSPIQDFLLENELTVSSSKILSEMHCLVRKFLKTYKELDTRCRWEVNRKRPCSPAVTLSLRMIGMNSDELISVDMVPALMVQERQGWPLAIRNGPNVDNWLGKKGRQEIKGFPCFFVPKRLKGRNISKDAKESWRISFSLIEKEMITKHGNSKTCCETPAKKCCRKQCLMLLKSLIMGLKQRFPKELDGLCSYHGKTTFLHTLSIRFEDNMWAPQKLPDCFLHLLGALEDYGRRGVLPHFFVRECNLFAPAVFPRKALAFLVNALEEQRREGLPLLKPTAPVSPLKRVSISEVTSTKHPSAAEAAKPLHTGFRNNLFLVLVPGGAVALGLCFIFLI